EIARELGVGVHYPENADIADEASGFPLVGRSVHSPESAVAIDGVDYVVAGHVFETGSKAGSQPLGVEGLAAIVAASSAPVLAIGGITPDRVQAVLETGAHGIAVMSGIVSAEDPARAAEAYRAALQVSKSKMQGTISMPISLTVNGKTVEIKRPLTIQAFLDSRNLHRNMVVVEHNGVILKKSQFGEVQLASGDVLEVVHFVGGG
ncbi:MAG: sulfur carrier protein ThiS, partial [Thermomicrobiales bacterium]